MHREIPPWAGVNHLYLKLYKDIRILNKNFGKQSMGIGIVGDTPGR